MKSVISIHIGCDIVYIPRFKKILKRTPAMRSRIFLPSETKGASDDTLAGIFTAKEAITKALSLKAGAWRNIEVRKSKMGRPEIKIAGLAKHITSQDISIAHDGEYAMAVVVFLLK